MLAACSLLASSRDALSHCEAKHAAPLSACSAMLAARDSPDAGQLTSRLRPCCWPAVEVSLPSRAPACLQSAGQLEESSALSAVSGMLAYLTAPGAGQLVAGCPRVAALLWRRTPQQITCMLAACNLLASITHAERCVCHAGFVTQPWMLISWLQAAHMLLVCCGGAPPQQGTGMLAACSLLVSPRQAIR